MTDEDTTRGGTSGREADGPFGALRAPEVWTAPPADLFDRISGELGIASTPAEERPAALGPRPTRRFGWRAIPAVAAAAAALFGAGVVVGGFGDDSGEAAEPRPVAELTLTGTELAPRAVADVEVFDRGAGYALILDTKHLAPAPEGRFYQGWLRSTDGVEISVGTFHMRGGDDVVVLWSGVSIDLYPTLVIRLGGGDTVADLAPDETVMIGNLTAI